MQNFISTNTWIWSTNDKLVITVTKGKASYIIKFKMGYSEVSLSFDRDSLIELRDNISSKLLLDLEPKPDDSVISEEVNSKD
jgi:hypothetical protein